MMAQVREQWGTGTEWFEYHGNTAVERVRRHNGVTIMRDWILFDTVEDAEAFFNDHCCDTAETIH